MIRCNSNRKMTLEQRIARLEKLLKNEARNANGYISGSDSSFEDQHLEDAAMRQADRLAKMFAQSTGISLLRDNSHPTVNSPLYGWTDDRNINNDPDAYYVLSMMFRVEILVSICVHQKVQRVFGFH